MNSNQARERCEQCLNTLYVQRDLERIQDFFSEDVVAHPMPPGVPPGLPGVKAMTQAWLEGFSELSVKLETFNHEQDQVALQLVVTGKHTGSFMGIAPTGRSFSIIDKPRYRLENGKIAEMWHDPDINGLMRQIS
jgi:predicted ester cyclase